MFNYYGLLHDPNTLLNGRFAGVFQYPNTFGMVMALFFFFSLINLTEEKINNKKVFFHSSFSLLYFVCLIQSSSRGMMMLFPVIWLAGLLLLPLKKQVIYLLQTFSTIFPSIIVYQSMVKGVSAGVHSPGLLMMFCYVNDHQWSCLCYPLENL
jgi:O-antigen ligase